MRHVLCDVIQSGLTKIPNENAPEAPTMECYRKNDKVVLGLFGTKLPDK